MAGRRIRGCFRTSRFESFSEETLGKEENRRARKQNNPQRHALRPVDIFQQVEDPAGTISIVDSMTGSSAASGSACGAGGSALVTLDADANLDYVPDAETAKPAPRHSGGFNALYGDGHTHWKKHGTTTPCDWSIQADPYPTGSQAIQDACAKK